MSSSYWFFFFRKKLYFFIYVLPLTKIHCFYIVSRHTLGEQGEGVYFLFSQEDILSLLLQNYYSGSSPGVMSIFSYSPDTDNLWPFHMGDSWAPSSGKRGTNLFFRAGSRESWAGLGHRPAEHCRADVPRLPAKANTSPCASISCGEGEPTLLEKTQVQLQGR